MKPFLRNHEKKAPEHSLSGRQKIQYIWDYYKLQLLLGLTALCILISFIQKKITQKETILYVSTVNVSAGEASVKKLEQDFLTANQVDQKKKQLSLAAGLYLSDDPSQADHEYSYATRLKILGAIDAEKIDVVLMNQEAFDAFSQNGYLCNMEQFLSDYLKDSASSLEEELVVNTEILEDNASDLLLDDTIPYHAETTRYPMGLKLDHSPVITASGFQDTIYLGVIKNSPRKKMAASYITYLFHED